MSARGEIVLLSLLADYESLDVLANIGMPLAAVPTEDCRKIVEWALEYYYSSGRRQAPTPEGFKVTWGEKLSDLEIELIQPEDSDTMEWAVEDLKADYAKSQVQSFTRDFATAIAGDTHVLEIPQIIHDYAGKLIELDLNLADEHSVVPVGAGLDMRIQAYEERVGEEKGKRGLLSGIDMIDNHSGGTHPGEITVCGAAAKTGKSFWLALIALNSWLRGDRPVLFTLENSKEMTLDRIACLGAHVDGQRFESGELLEHELRRIRDFRAELGDEIFVVEPGNDDRTPAALHRQMQLLEGTAMIVDQLTWVNHPKPDSRRSRTIEIKDIMHQFRDAITGKEAVPLYLAHQINREGIAKARKLGYLEMTDFAESAEVERVVSQGYGLYQSRENGIVGRMLFQTLASRRVPPKHWLLSWNLGQGVIAGLQETQLPTTSA
jgi:hypothetical protein